MTKTRKLIAAVLILIMALTMTQVSAFAGDNGSDIATMASCDIAASGDEEGGDGDQSGSDGATDPTDTSNSTDPTQAIDPTSSSEDPTEPSGSTEATDPTEPSSTTQPTTTTKPTTTQPTTAPKPVVPKVTVKKSGPSLLVSWTAITGANYYEVYRSYKKGARGTLLKKVTKGRTYTDKAVKSGKRAYYTVRAHKSAGGFSGYSAVKSGIIYRVYIETGHGIDSRGRWDPGCTWKKYQEAKLMIPICKSMTKYLRSKGVYVYTDAFNGNKTNLIWMLKHLKGYNVSVLVNVHCDYKGAPRGTLPLYRYSDQKKLAKALNAGVHKTVSIKDRGVRYRKNLACLNQTHSYCTSCLFETGNIKKDNKILRTKYDAYGKGLAMGVCDYLGVKW